MEVYKNQDSNIEKTTANRIINKKLKEEVRNGECEKSN